MTKRLKLDSKLEYMLYNDIDNMLLFSFRFLMSFTPFLSFLFFDFSLLFIYKSIITYNMLFVKSLL
jgi:hypothetical protein